MPQEPVVSYGLVNWGNCTMMTPTDDRWGSIVSLMQHRLPIFTLLLFLLVTAGTPGCDRTEEEIDTNLGPAPLIDRPNAVPPTVQFPPQLQTSDPTLNLFIENALDVCARGDYAGFRLLFASTYTPPIESDFQRIWAGVKSVQIVSVHADPKERDQYYVHAVVQLRAPDARQRTKRDAIVAVQREGGEWRLSPPPKEVVHKILVIDSRPADETSRESAVRGANTSRPSTAPGV